MDLVEENPIIIDYDEVFDASAAQSPFVVPALAAGLPEVDGIPALSESVNGKRGLDSVELAQGLVSLDDTDSTLSEGKFELLLY